MAEVKSSPKEFGNFSATGYGDLQEVTARVKTLGSNGDYAGSATDYVTIARDAFAATGGDPYMIVHFNFTADGAGSASLLVNGTSVAGILVASAKEYMVEAHLWRDGVTLELRAFTKWFNVTDGTYETDISNLSVAQTSALYSSGFNVELTSTNLNDALDHYGVVAFA